MHVGIKTRIWRALGAVALLVAAHPASADFVYGISTGSEHNKLNIDGTIELQSGDNQGWWSDTAPNIAGNTNYVVGLLDEQAGDLRNNFFVFNISDLTEPVTSAVLQLQVWNVFSSTAASTVLYSLFDVTTDIAALKNVASGPNASIYNDLGSGKHYGSFEISTSLVSTDVVTLTLNGAALADLNAAIEAHAVNFAIGGTLSFKPVPVETTVPDAANTLVLLVLALVCLWAVRRRKQES